MSDAEVSNTFNRIPAALLGGTAALAVAILIAGSIITFAPRTAEAKPEFTGQTGKACGVCHQNPAGGGKLKPAGEQFKQDRKK
jgi:hypothetical protein